MSSDSTPGPQRIGRRLLALGLLCLLPSCQSKRPAFQCRVPSPPESHPPSVRLWEAMADMDYFFKTVEKVHYNHLANISKEDYQRLKKRSKEELDTAADPNGCVPRRFLALTAAKAAAALGDGHTDVPLTTELLEPRDDTPCMLPFRLNWRAGHVVVGDIIPELRQIQGARLVDINGPTLKDALEPIVSHISGERWESRVGDFLRQQELYWPLIRPVLGQTATVTVQPVGRTPQVLKLNLISLEQYRQGIPPSPTRHPLGTWTFYHEGRTCYWQYNQC